MALLVILSAADAEPSRPPTAAAPPLPVVTCASLANLRLVLRKSEGDPAAVETLIKDPRADLGCTILDPAAVTGIAEHVSLNGIAYDCLALQHTSICHWVVAGAARTQAAPAAPAASGTPKPRR